MTNTTAGRPIDPRFDPAFQPGYDPQSDPSRAARVPSYDAAVDSPRLQPGRVIEPEPRRYAEPRPLVEPRTLAEPRTLTDTRAATEARRSAESRGSVDPQGYDGHRRGEESDAGSRAPEGHDLEPATGPGRNPFLLALWILGLVFIGLGLFTGQQVLDPSTDLMVAALKGESVNYFSVQLFTFGAPMLVVLGLLTMTLALFTHALRWRGARSGMTGHV